MEAFIPRHSIEISMPFQRRKQTVSFSISVLSSYEKWTMEAAGALKKNGINKSLFCSDQLLTSLFLAWPVTQTQGEKIRSKSTVCRPKIANRLAQLGGNSEDFWEQQPPAIPHPAGEGNWMRFLKANEEKRVWSRQCACVCAVCACVRACCLPVCDVCTISLGESLRSLHAATNSKLLQSSCAALVLLFLLSVKEDEDDKCRNTWHPRRSAAGACIHHRYLTKSSARQRHSSIFTSMCDSHLLPSLMCRHSQLERGSWWDTRHWLRRTGRIELWISIGCPICVGDRNGKTYSAIIIKTQSQRRRLIWKAKLSQ